MLTESYRKLLEQWETNARIKTDLESESIAMSRNDSVKLAALAEIYSLPKAEIIAQLLHVALGDLEEQMPYVPGSKVIRVEEGGNVYEDIGPMPRYLAAQKALKKNS
ncbi:MAG: hypothetical protein WBN40_05095 [Pseudomonadales bacterium]